MQNKVNGSRHGIATVEGTSPTSLHLYPLYHVGRDELQPIDAHEPAENRMPINKSLGVLALHAIEAHLVETAILAVILHTNP